MAKETILIITDNERHFRHPRFVLTAEGFILVTAENNSTALLTASKTTPSLILMDQEEFRRDGLEFMEKLRERKMSIPVIVYPAFESTIEEFIKAEVHDYLFFGETSELVNTVKRALAFNTNPKYVSMPIVEKLLETIERQRQEYQRLWVDYEWYKENVNRSACNCQELIDSKERWWMPKSTALKQLGQIDVSPMHGDYYECQVCGTKWINWTEVGFGNYGGWELAEELDDIIEADDITYFEEPPEQGKS